MISNFIYISRIADAYRKMISEATLKTGRDKRGFDKNVRDIFGYDREGYDESGRDIFGCDRSGYDEDGYDRLGFDRDGWNAEGFPSPNRDPGAYSITPEQVDDKIREMLETKMKHARATLYRMLKSGKDVRGVYIKTYPRRHLDPEERALVERDKELIGKALREYEAQLKQKEKERIMSSPEWHAEQERKREERNALRRTPESREKNNAYMRDYARAKRLLYGRGRWSKADIVWAFNNPIYNNMKKRKEERESAEKARMEYARFSGKPESEISSTSEIPNFFSNLRDFK